MLAAALALAPLGCAAHSPPAERVRYATLQHAPQRGRLRLPVILEFQPGDRLAVALSFNGQMFRLEPSEPPLELVATRHCYVRIDQDGFRTSFDGRDFDAKPEAPGRFFAGFSNTRDGTRFVVTVTSPRRREPK